MSVYEDRPWIAHYPNGLGQDLDLSFATMFEAWEHRVGRFPDSPCVLYCEHAFTFADVDAMAGALAVALQSFGVEPGDRIGVYLQNDPQWPVCMVAAWKASAIPVALNPMLKERELAYQLVDCGARVLVCLEDLYRDVVSSVIHRTGVECVITTHPFDLLPEAAVPDPGTSQIAPERLSRRLGTCGRSSMPIVGERLWPLALRLTTSPS